MPNAAGSHRVLVVEGDSRSVAQLTAEARQLGLELVAHSSAAHVGRAIGREVTVGLVEERLPDGNGIALVTDLARVSPTVQWIVMSGRPSFAGAVNAIKAGASDYLAKPVSLARLVGFASSADVPEILSPAFVAWEYLHRLVVEAGSLSQAARWLRMDRHALRRKLQKVPPR